MSIGNAMLIISFMKMKWYERDLWSDIEGYGFIYFC